MSPVISGGGGGGGFANPMTTAGDIIIENNTPAAARLAVGSGTQLLGVSAGLPAWVAAPAGGKPAANRIGQAVTGRGFLCENFPVMLCTTVTNTAGSQVVIFVGNLAVLNGDVVTGVVINVATAASGSNPTGVFVGLYTTAGVQLAVSNNLNASAIWTAQGFAQAAFSAQYTSGSDQSVYAAFVINGTWGTTAMQYNTKTTDTDPHPLFPLGLNQQALGVQTGQATLPAPATIANPGASTAVPWMALY